jgi:rhodanese-related sulfurtransferase
MPDRLHLDPAFALSYIRKIEKANTHSIKLRGTTVFGIFSAKNLSPSEVKSGHDGGELLLVDVREPGEFAAEHIKGAVNIPLSKIASAAFPEAGGKTIVLQCAGGLRSAKAVQACRKRGLKVEHHLAGGISAWKAAGYPTIR